LASEEFTGWEEGFSPVTNELMTSQHLKGGTFGRIWWVPLRKTDGRGECEVFFGPHVGKATG